MDPALSTNEPAPAAPAVPGYELMRQIGRGGYGIVYLARKTTDSSYHAAKVVFRDMFESDEPYLREWNGIQNYKTLNCHSPFLLEVIDLFKSPDGSFFCYVMELSDDAAGRPVIEPASYKPRTLKQELEKSGRRQRLPARQCIEIALGLAKGLQTLHNNGLVHRDVKPSNILFVRGVPKLGDIGLVTDQEASLTKYTPQAYAAPEAEHALRADIYGFGKVLYEMCTGLTVDRFPSLPTTFKDWEDHAACLQLNRVIATACAVELRDRYGSFQDLIRDLESIRDGREIETRSRPARAVAILALILFIAVGTTIWATRHSSAPVAMTPKVPSAISLVQLPVIAGRQAVPPSNLVAQAKQKLLIEQEQRPLAPTFVERQANLSSMIEDVRQLRDPVEIYARLQWLKELAIADADHISGLRICDEMARRFVFDVQQVNEMKAELMEAVARTAKAPWQCTGVGKGSTRLGFLCLAMDDFRAGNQLLKTALWSVSRADNHLIGTNAAFLKDELAVAEPWFKRIAPFVARVELNPTDREAATECGKYLCFAKNAWPKGLALLQNGNGKLAEMARLELTGGKSTSTAESLGDAWAKLAKETANRDRDFFGRRAAYWYAVACAGETDSQLRGALDLKRKQLLERYPPSKAILRIAVKTPGHSKFVVTSQEITLTSLRGVEEVHVNWYRWGNIKAGGPDIYPNYGETRYLPSHVDFNRASISRQHIGNSSAPAIKFSTFPDRFEIEVGDLPTPTAFEWEIVL